MTNRSILRAIALAAAMLPSSLLVQFTPARGQNNLPDAQKPKIAANLKKSLTPAHYDEEKGSSNMPQQTDQKSGTPKRVIPNQDDINYAKSTEALMSNYRKEEVNKSIALNVEPDKDERTEILAEQALPHKDGGEIDWDAVNKTPGKYANNRYVREVKELAEFKAEVRVKAESLIPNMTQAEKDLLRPTASEWNLAKKESIRDAVASKDDFEGRGFEIHDDMLALPHDGKAIDWDQIARSWDKYKANSFVQDVQIGAKVYGEERYRLTHPGIRLDEVQSKFENDPRPPLSASMLDEAAKDAADRTRRLGNETATPATQVPGTARQLPGATAQPAPADAAPVAAPKPAPVPVGPPL